MGSYEVIPKLEWLIANTFPHAEEAQVAEWAERIYEDYTIGTALEGIQRDDKSSSHDIEAFFRAINQVRRAGNSVRSVGWHGRKALGDTFSQTKLPIFLAIKDMPVSATPLEDMLDSIVDFLQACVKNIAEDAPSINSAFGDGPGFDRRMTKHAAYCAKLVSVRTAETFQYLAGEAPTLRTEYGSGVAYGPFYEFLSDIFKVLGISASVVHWARHALSMKEP
jgi:hypothetical protein